MSTYGPKADNLGASATGPNMAVFEQDKSASESAQAEWDSRQQKDREQESAKRHMWCARRKGRLARGGPRQRPTSMQHPIKLIATLPRGVVEKVWAD